MNKVNIMGRLTRDPELRRTQSGTAVCSFTVAINRDYGKDGERKADFIPCVAWSGTAEFVSKYFPKGRMIALSGRLQTRDWTDDDGKKHYVMEVIAESVYFCGDKKSDTEFENRTGTEYESRTSAPSTKAQTQSSFSDYYEDDGDLPF